MINNMDRLDQKILQNINIGQSKRELISIISDGAVFWYAKSHNIHNSLAI